MASVEGSALKRLGLALASICLAAAASGCSETAGRATSEAAAPSARTDFVDAGQPIVLNGSGPPVGQVSAGQAAPGTEAASIAPRARPQPPAAGSGPPDAVAATAIVEPSTADIAPPEPSPEGVTTLSDDPVPSPGGTPVATATPEPRLDGERVLPAAEKAKLIGELKALAARQGAAAGPADAPDAADAAARAALCDPATDPECAVAAE